VTVTFRQAALDDLIRQFRYYLVTLDLPQVALHFREAVKKTTKELSRHPHIAAPYRLRNPELRGLRSWPVDGFESLRLYVLVKDGAMRVIRILHGKRDVRGILERERFSGS
jgi:toxin ParE1/3/4